MKLDPRKFSQEAYTALTKLKSELDSSDHKKASSLVQGLTAYISTWGLHRLGGDAKKFSGQRGENTKYKGKVYATFLASLQDFSKQDFDPEDEATLIQMPLRKYTALNHLAMQLAKEWSFWAAAVLGEAE